MPLTLRREVAHKGQKTAGIGIEGDVVDMESFALAFVCQQMNIPFFSIKYVTDVIGKNSIKEWEDKLKALKLDPKIEEKVLKEINKFTKMMPSSAESGVIRNYVETIVSLPWNKSAKTMPPLQTLVISRPLTYRLNIVEP